MLKESADPIRRYWKERFPEIAADNAFDRAALVHAATEGLWFMEVLKLSPFFEGQRSRLVEILLSIVEDSVLQPGDAALNPVPLYKDAPAAHVPAPVAKPKSAARTRRPSKTSGST